MLDSLPLHADIFLVAQPAWYRPSAVTCGLIMLKLNGVT